MANKVGVTAVLSLDQRDFQRNMAKGISVAKSAAKQIAAVAIGGGIFAVNEAVAFDAGMRKVNQIARLSGPAFRKLSGDAMELSDSVGIAHRSLTGGLYAALSASIPQKNLLEYSKTASKAAIAGYTDLETSVRASANVINSFSNKNVEDTEAIFDTLFKTVEKGQITFIDLADNIAKVSGLADSMGISFEDSMGMIAHLTTAGESPEMAFTKLAAVMASILKPSEELQKKMAELYAGMSPDQAVREFGLAKVMDKISSSVNNSSKELAKFFTEKRALQGVLKMTGAQAKVMEGRMNEVTNATGAMNSALSETEKSAARVFEKAKVQLQNLGIVIGSEALPAIAKLGKSLKGTITKETIEPLVDGMALAAESAVLMVKKLQESGKWLGDFIAKYQNWQAKMSGATVDKNGNIGFAGPSSLETAAAARLKAAGITPGATGIVPRLVPGGIPGRGAAGITEQQALTMGAFNYAGELARTVSAIKTGEKPWETQQRIANSIMIELLNVTKERLPQAVNK